ncbi:MAG: HAD family hydrolase [Frankiaceae bacterium]|nr:HAD family hydrolase [Frankiaceae bacterium]MBV9871147.1 HAD family hydrolase [Frankiaceae bacterium]
MAAGVLFDVDGTLVDTNYHHVVAWADAFERAGHRVPMSRLHGLIGQGSERLVETVLGHTDEAIVDGHADFYAPRLQRLQPFDGAADLLRKCKDSGLTVVLATSAASHDAEHMLDTLGVADVVDHVTTNDDADASKPAPDIVEAALEACGLKAADCVFIGDSVWDVKAAQRAGMPCIGVLTGGIDERVLREAGAHSIFEGVRDLLERFQDSLLGELVAAA